MLLSQHPSILSVLPMCALNRMGLPLFPLSLSLSLSQTISAYYTPLPLSFLTALYKQTGMVFQRRGTLERVGFF